MATIPKRTEELQRDRARKGVRDPVTYGQLQPVDIDNFAPSEDWHPTALMIWESALRSGQAHWYQESDLALLYLACEEITRYKQSGKPSAMLLKEIMDILSSLLMSEGARRAARMELQRPKEPEVDLATAGMEAYSEFWKEPALQRALQTQ